MARTTGATIDTSTTADQNDDDCGTGYHVAVIVLGDVGRSPRMQYHALSLLTRGFRVSLIGYDGEELIPELQRYEASRLEVVRFSPAATYRGGAYKPLYYLLRLYALASGLYRALWVRLSSVPHCLLVQNPPSVPLLLLGWLYCHTHTHTHTPHNNKHRRPGLVIDWHNLGHTMFPYGPRHPVCVLARAYERCLGRRGDYHLCVSHAMQKFLCRHGYVRSADTTDVLHDRPPDFFRRSSPEEFHRVLVKYRNDGLRDCFPELQPPVPHDGTTLCTRRTPTAAGYVYQLREDRPRLVVSSTSWTPDEDFAVLLDALVRLDARVVQEGLTIGTDFPRIVVVVTGKGPQKADYETRIRHCNDDLLTLVSIHTLWLESADYPTFIGSADLGVSLHTSTSGIDLPMKVLDMFGCGVPVCALEFACVGELVKDGVNGRLFRDAGGLQEELYGLFLNKEGNGGGPTALEGLREGVRRTTGRWQDNWDAHARDVMLRACRCEGAAWSPTLLAFYVGPVLATCVGVTLWYLIQ